MNDVRTPTEAALDKAYRALGSFIWLGNNLHNSGTETFRELYRAALDDARTAYVAGARLLGDDTAADAVEAEQP